MAAGVALAGGTALAYMPPEVYIGLRAEAPAHIQLLVDRVAPPPEPRGFGDCVVSGRVATIFRDRGGVLGKGQAITVAVPCLRPGLPPDAIPVGGTSWRNLDRLSAAAVIELHVQGGPTDFGVADHGDGLRMLDGPTTQPTIIDPPL